MKIYIRKNLVLFIWIFLCSPQAFTQTQTQKNYSQQTSEVADFNSAIKTETIKAMSEFIKKYPNSKLVTDAINKIEQILETEFPKKKYYWKMNYCNMSNELFSFSDLQRDLTHAIISDDPIIISFNPKKVYGVGYWNWDIYFRELAGQSVELCIRSAYIKNGNVAYNEKSSVDGMLGSRVSIIIPAYSKGSDNYWCKLGSVDYGNYINATIYYTVKEPCNIKLRTIARLEKEK